MIIQLLSSFFDGDVLHRKQLFIPLPKLYHHHCSLQVQSLILPLISELPSYE